MVQTFVLFRGWVGYHENKNSESLKCVYFVWSQHREGVKIKTKKISSGGDTGESLHQRKFPTIYTVYIAHRYCKNIIITHCHPSSQSRCNDILVGRL